MNEKSMVSIRDYSSAGVFSEADVYPVVFVLSNNQTRISGTSVARMETIDAIPYHTIVPPNVFHKDVHWSRYFGPPETVELLSRMSTMKRIRSRSLSVLGAATVAEAYQIKNVIRDDETYSGFRLINTGTIDPYCSLWGIRQTQYIKSRFQYPIVDGRELSKINKVRLEQAIAPKIIVAGMGKQLEAFLDRGEHLAGKSTIIILGAFAELQFLVGILNSKLLSFFLNQFYSPLRMSGGYINIGKEVIQSLPIPGELNSLLTKRIGNVGERIASERAQDRSADVSALEAEIDHIVYKLYNLTPEEIAIVEESTAGSRGKARKMESPKEKHGSSRKTSRKKATTSLPPSRPGWD